MTLTRPKTLAEMIIRQDYFATDPGVSQGLSYQPDPTDVFISPYAKCGTTWMQQIVHGLRSNGSMQFSEITEVVPWLELAHDMGIDIQAPQVALPHAFKSHLSWNDIPKGGRYIVVFRDPIDAMISLHRFLEGWFFETGSVSMAEFADYYLDRGKEENYWSHACSWWAQRDNPNVLCFAFEQMKANLPAVVNQVADFIGIAPSSLARQIATKQAQFDFMKRHKDQFDDHLIRETRDPACGLPPGGDSAKVSRGKSGAGATTITSELRAKFEARWRETMTSQFGLSSYSDLLQALGSY